jgi:hypothetical protein
MLVRQGHRGDLGAAPCPQLWEPDTAGVLFPLSPSDDGHGALEQEPAQIWIASFAHTAKPRLAAGPMLRRHQPQPGRAMPAIFEGPRILDRGDEGGGGQRPHAFDPRQPLRDLGLRGELGNPGVVASNLGSVANSARGVLEGESSTVGKGLRSQSVELFGRSEALAFDPDHHLFLFDHVHEFNTS